MDARVVDALGKPESRSNDLTKSDPCRVGYQKKKKHKALHHQRERHSTVRALELWAPSPSPSTSITPSNVACPTAPSSRGRLVVDFWGMYVASRLRCCV